MLMCRLSPTATHSHLFPWFSQRYIGGRQDRIRENFGLCDSINRETLLREMECRWWLSSSHYHSHSRIGITGDHLDASIFQIIFENMMSWILVCLKFVCKHIKYLALEFLKWNVRAWEILRQNNKWLRMSVWSTNWPTRNADLLLLLRHRWSQQVM